MRKKLRLFSLTFKTTAKNSVEYLPVAGAFHAIISTITVFHMVTYLMQSTFLLAIAVTFSYVRLGYAAIAVDKCY
jgi:hypothetical protein